MSDGTDQPNTIEGITLVTEPAARRLNDRIRLTAEKNHVTISLPEPSEPSRDDNGNRSLNSI